MSTLTILLVLAAVIFVVLFVWRKRAGKKLMAAGGAVIDEIADNIANKKKLAILQSQIDDAADEVAQSEKSLAAYKGQLNMITAQVEQNKRDIAILGARAKTAVQKDNDAKAGELLLKKKKIEAELQKNEAQLKSYQNLYEGALAQLKHAQRRVDSARDNASDLKNQLNMSKYTANMANMAKSFNVNTGRFDDLKTLEDGIRADINTNLAQAEVIQDLYGDKLNEIEEEEALEQAEAADELAKLKAEMNQPAT